VNTLSASDLLIAAVAVILGGKRLWVHESPQAKLELPGYIVAKAEKAVIHLNKFLSELRIADLPHETLYLTAVKTEQNPRRKATALVRLIHCTKKPDIELPNHRFETFKELSEHEQASSLTKIVVDRLSHAN
jgi:hypothetical protein